MATDEAGSLTKATNGGVGAIQKIAELNGLGVPKIDPGHERCEFVYKVLVGYVVEVKTEDGATHEGIFHAMESGGVILRMARLVRDKNGITPRSTLPEPKKVISAEDWQEIKAKDVRMGGSDVGPQGAADDAGGFGTDASISRGRGGAQGRELQRWSPDSEDSHLMHLEASDMGGSGGASGWDQFALNERKFGVRTDYSEELYTTAFDPSKSKISVAEADRLASEILKGNKSNTTNVHVLEERGIEIDDGDMDEEDRYGAVIREAPAMGGGRGGTGGRPQHPQQQQQRAAQGAWSRGAPAAPAATSPISIDARREANKVRAQMTGASGKASSSPYGTPKAQLASPLVGDAQKLAALNLDPGIPRVDAATRRDFEEFKAQQRAGGAPGTLSEMKQFSESVGTKLQQKASPGGSASSTPSAAATAEAAKKPAAAAASSLTALNPNAKSFTFNVNAKSFTFAPKAGAGAAPSPPSAAAAAGAAATSSAGGPAVVASRPTPPPPPPTSHPQGIGGHGGPQYHHPQQQQHRQQAGHHNHRSFESGDGEPSGPYHHGSRDRQQQQHRGRDDHQQHHRDDRGGGGYEGRRGGDRGNGPLGGPQMAARSPPGGGMQMGHAGMHGAAMMGSAMSPMHPSPHGSGIVLMAQGMAPFAPPQIGGPRGYGPPYMAMSPGPNYPAHMQYAPRGAMGGQAVMMMPAHGMHPGLPMPGAFPAGMPYHGPGGGGGVPGGRPGAHSSGGGGHGSRGGGDRDGGGGDERGHK